MSDETSIITPEAIMDRIETLQREVGRLNRELDESSRLATLGLLAATIAHELRNLLTPVLGYAQLARSRPDDVNLCLRALEKTIHGVESASRVLESTLEFGASREPDGPVECDVRVTAEAALSLLASDISKSGVTVTLDLPAGLTVAMGGVQLQQVLLNLLLNALRAHRDGAAANARRGSRWIRIAGNPAADNRVEVRVIDNGPGISDGMIERLFQPFARGASDHDGRVTEGGAGLGLHICRRLVEERGGSIRAAPTHGGGATFAMTLPAGARGRLRRAG